MILIFFLQYLIYFGEVILSPLIYFSMKYILENKIIKPMILVSIFEKKSNIKTVKSPNLSEGP